MRKKFVAAALAACMLPGLCTPLSARERAVLNQNQAVLTSSQKGSPEKTTVLDSTLIGGTPDQYWYYKDKSWVFTYGETIYFQSPFGLYAYDPNSGTYGQILDLTTDGESWKYYQGVDGFQTGNTLYVMSQMNAWSNYEQSSYVARVDLTTRETQILGSVTAAYGEDEYQPTVAADEKGNIYLSHTIGNELYLEVYDSSFSLIRKIKANVPASSGYSFAQIVSADLENKTVYGQMNWMRSEYGYDTSGQTAVKGTINGDTLSFTILPLETDSYDSDIPFLGGWYNSTGKAEMMKVLGNRWLYVDYCELDTLSIYDLNGSMTSPSFARTNKKDQSLYINSVRAFWDEDRQSIIALISDSSNSIAEIEPSSGKVIRKWTAQNPVRDVFEAGGVLYALTQTDTDFYLEAFDYEDNGVSVSLPVSTLTPLQEVQMSVNSGNWEEALTYTSSNPKVASVSSSGLITGWSAGTAVITVSSLRGYKESFTVTVQASSASGSFESVPTIASNAGLMGSHGYSLYHANNVQDTIRENADGGYTTTVYSLAGTVTVRTFDSSNNQKSTKTITPPLSILGGVWQGDSYNYIVCGQSNPDESTSAEVMRVQQYSKNWDLIKEVSFYGENTYTPFEAGSLRFEETDDHLYIYTCHTMMDIGDGLHHQANMIFKLDKNTLETLDKMSGIMNFQDACYVSHSFNQYIKADGDRIYRADHGDAGDTRGVVVCINDDNGSVTEGLAHLKVFEAADFSGYHYNYTGIQLGGLEVTDNSVIVAGSSVDQSGGNPNGQQNIWVSIADKDLGSSRTVWLTDYPEGTDLTIINPHIVKYSTNSLMVVWNEVGWSTAETRGVFIDENGNVCSKTFLLDANRSSCQPVTFSDGTIRWTYSSYPDMKLAVINPRNLSKAVSASGAKIVLSTKDMTINVDDVRNITASVTGTSGQDSIDWTSADPSIASVTKTGTVSCTVKGLKEGKTTITAALSGDPDVTVSFQVTVNPKGTVVGTQKMHRLYNPNSGEHFYTASDVEKDAVVKAGWKYEGTGWTAPKTSGTPVYRLYNANAGDHHYTMDFNEYVTLQKLGWKDEGIGWYSDDAKTVKLYRQYNPNAVAGSHNYTTSLNEHNSLVALGWKDEGIAWYGVN